MENKGRKFLELDLLDNGLTSIMHGLEHYTDGIKDPTNYKFAITHISQGIELILKERLSREHWVLIFEKIEKPKGKTVDFDCSVERLQTICNVSLDKYIKELRSIKKTRNDIEHYKVKLSKDEALTLIGSIVPFLVEFLENELDVKLSDLLEQEIWQELLQIKEVYAKVKMQADEKVEALRWNEKDGGYHPIWSCASCGELYMVENEDADRHEPAQAKCLLCNHIAELKTCWKCGELFPEDDWDAEGGLCATCTDYINQPNT
jgi:hypothetical protein